MCKTGRSLRFDTSLGIVWWHSGRASTHTFMYITLFLTHTWCSLRLGATSTSLDVCQVQSPRTLRWAKSARALNMASPEMPPLAGPPSLSGPPTRIVPTTRTVIEGPLPLREIGEVFSPSYLSIFKEWDRDGNGLIDVEEFGEVMKKLRQRKSSSLTEVEADLATADSYGVEMVRENISILIRFSCCKERTHEHARIHTHTHTHTHTHSHTHTTHTHMRTHMSCTGVRARTHTHTHTCTHSLSLSHTHIHMQISGNTSHIYGD